MEKIEIGLPLSIESAKAIHDLLDEHLSRLARKHGKIPENDVLAPVFANLHRILYHDDK